MSEREDGKMETWRENGRENVKIDRYRRASEKGIYTYIHTYNMDRESETLTGRRTDRHTDREARQIIQTSPLSFLSMYFNICCSISPTCELST